MCTLTWRSLPGGGYEVYFNRDELRSRKPAQAPQLFNLAGSAVLAPVDGEAGGTWISVNEHGVGLCLLNYYQGLATLPETGRFISRGLLVRELAHHRNSQSAESALRSFPHARCQPFRLLLLAAGRAPLLYTWTGSALQCDTAPAVPLVSSGLDIEAATQNRQSLYREIVAGSPVTEQHLLRFHSSHHPAPSPQSVCMHRPEAETVSMTRLRIDIDEVSLAYADGSPCRAALGPPLSLARVGTAAV